MKGRLLAFVACGLLGISLLSGCGGKANTVSQEEPAQTNESTSNDSSNKVTDSNQTTDNQSTESELDYQTVNLGDTITTDFVEITVDSASTSKDILPTDTSSVYSHYPAEDGSTYFFLKGTIKNTGTDKYDAEDMRITLTFDDKYNYDGQALIDDGGSDFYGSTLDPFKSATYYLTAAIPDELINSYQTCTIKFGFADNFSVSYFESDWNEFTNRYQITVTK
ncbi:MAG: DUF4352 domain-containing protein [Lachnospiraceae bacterium]|nr:DUF4352 domain-containing protein [Lachnospiraceae bacterium]